MKLEDVPVEEFLPTCSECGAEIDGDGYKDNDGNYLCEDCMHDKYKEINGYEEAEERRYSAYEEAEEARFEVAHENQVQR